MLTHTEALLAFIDLGARPPARRHDRPAGEHDAARPRRIAAGARRPGPPHQALAPALMDAATEPGVGFAADGEGGYILPGFLPAFDAAAALLKMLDLLARRDTRLSDVVDDLPRVHVAHETIVTPWEQKGLVMRSLVEHGQAASWSSSTASRCSTTTAGRWPCPTRRSRHPCVGRGRHRRRRPQLAQEYVRRIRQLLR